MKATPDIDQMLNITTHSRSKGTESYTLIIRAVPSVPSNAPHERRGHSRLSLALYRSRGARCGS